MKTKAKTTSVVIPTVLTSSCYFWRSGQTANLRRSAECKHHLAVQHFLNDIGFTTDIRGHLTFGDTIMLSGEKIYLEFLYQESCNNVYKRLTIYKDDELTNIRTLKKIAKERGIEIIKE